MAGEKYQYIWGSTLNFAVAIDRGVAIVANMDANNELGLSAEFRFDARCDELGIQISGRSTNASWDRKVVVRGENKTVQVKTTAVLVLHSRGSGKKCWRYFVSGRRETVVKCFYRDAGVDFMAIYIRPQGRWFIIPAAEAASNKIKISPNPGGKMLRAMERWDLLGAKPSV